MSTLPLSFRLILFLVLVVIVPSLQAQPTTQPAAASPVPPRKLGSLHLLYQEAVAQPLGSAKRKEILEQFLTDSQAIVTQDPKLTNVWLFRAAVAIELDRPKVGWEAGRKLIALGIDQSQDASVQAIMTQLEHRKWLDDKPPPETTTPPAPAAPATPVPAPSPSAAAAQTQPAPMLSDDDQLEWLAIQTLVRNAADQPQAAGDLLVQVLARGEKLKEKLKDNIQFWFIRGAAALALDRANEGHEAGSHLKDLGVLHSNNEKAKALLGELATRGWMAIGKTIVNSIGMKLTYIPAGLMPDQKHMNAFLMGVTEVTQAQWRAVMVNNPSRFHGDDLPVEQVSRNAALEFCEKLSLKEGKQYRLPSDVEWTYACLAGASGPYGGTGKLDDMGWYNVNAEEKTHPVGQKKPNAWGLYDMHGNVLEWNNPVNEYDAGHLTGGSWKLDADQCRVGSNIWAGTDQAFDDWGFRVVCIVPSPP